MIPCQDRTPDRSDPEAVDIPRSTILPMVKRFSPITRIPCSSETACDLDKSEIHGETFTGRSFVAIDAFFGMFCANMPQPRQIGSLD